MGASSLRQQSDSLCLVDPRYGMMHEPAAFDIDRVIDRRPVTSDATGFEHFTFQFEAAARAGHETAAHQTVYRQTIGR
jgi:hypothetical protein